jgi:hypothetical protein
VDAQNAKRELNLHNVPRTARSLIVAAVKALGAGWQATFFKSHIISYKENRDYKHGVAQRA